MWRIVVTANRQRGSCTSSSRSTARADAVRSVGASSIAPTTGSSVSLAFSSGGGIDSSAPSAHGPPCVRRLVDASRSRRAGAAGPHGETTSRAMMAQPFTSGVATDLRRRSRLRGSGVSRCRSGRGTARRTASRRRASTKPCGSVIQNGFLDDHLGRLGIRAEERDHGCRRDPHGLRTEPDGRDATFLHGRERVPRLMLNARATSGTDIVGCTVGSGTPCKKALFVQARFVSVMSSTLAQLTRTSP